MNIDTLLSYILVKEDCSRFLKEKTFKSCREFIQFIKPIIEAESLHHPVHAIIENSEVKLLTVHGNNNIISSIVQKIEKSVRERSKIKKGSTEPCAHLQTGSIIKMELLRKSVKISEQNYNYSKMFLMDDLKKIQSNSSCESIDLTYNNIQITGFQQNVESACGKVQNLISKINSHTKILAYPNLLTFIKSSEGYQVIDNISKKFKCLIEFPNINPKTSPSLEAVQNETVRLDYRALLLQTARFEGFNIHLIQGNLGDMELSMVVEFSPSIQGSIWCLNNFLSYNKICN